MITESMEWERSLEEDDDRRSLSDIIDRIFSQITREFNELLGLYAEPEEPLTHVIDRDREIEIVLELPDCDRDSFSVRRSRNKIRVEAYGLERAYRKVIEVPKGVDASRMRVEFKGGLLIIRLPKKR